ncbi:hypothetical protein ACE6H2_017941 [Prunus campanulata]
MRSFLAMLVLALVAVYLLLGVFPATSTLLPQAEGGEKSTLSQVDCRDGLRKIIGRKEGSFGCQSDFVSKKIVPIRSLRITLTSSPPSPIKNLPKSQGGYAPPPLVI